MPAPHSVRQITDSRVLAAMAHPLRRRLLDLLHIDGPATASVLADKTGQAVGNVSHHLKTLAAAELIEEAPELARDRRERWWRRSTERISWSSRDFRGDPAGEAVASAATSLNLEHDISHIRAWFAADDAVRDSWAGGPFVTDTWLHLTPSELAELSAELLTLLGRFRDRPAGGETGPRPVLFFAAGAPGQP